MIINLHNWKRLGIIAAVILIPVIGIIALDRTVDYFYKPVSQTETRNADLEAAINKELNQQLTETSRQEQNYFASYRIKRDQVRGERMVLLREIAGNPATETTARDAAELKIIDLSERIEKEIQAETIVKSYGIPDCAVIIEENAVSVIIGKSLGEEKMQGLISAVSRATGKKMENIHISVHEGTSN